VDKARTEYPHPNHPFWRQAFEETASRVVAFARENPDPLTEPFLYLDDAQYPAHPNAQVRTGATYRSLYYVAHRLGMSETQRAGWVQVAQQAGLSQAHVGHIIAALDRQDAAVAALTADIESADDRI
jgi:hypothetical protein